VWRAGPAYELAAFAVRDDVASHRDPDVRRLLQDLLAKPVTWPPPALTISTSLRLRTEKSAGRFVSWPPSVKIISPEVIFRVLWNSTTSPAA
jgi:hypothetical protein